MEPLGQRLGDPGAVGDMLIQPAAWIGVHGLTLATLLLAATAMLRWRWRVAGAACSPPGSASAWSGCSRPSRRAPLTVVLVQGNVAQGQKWDQDLAVRIFRHYLDLTAQARASRRRRRGDLAGNRQPGPARCRRTGAAG